ncbi:MAG: glycosyltransferase [Acidimicrobiia bacterium]
MTIVVNGVAARLGGGARHFWPFIGGLANALPDATLRVHTGLLDRPGSLPSSVEVVARSVPMGMSAKRMWWDQVEVPRAVKGSDVLISPLNFGPLKVRTPQLLFSRNPTYFDRTFTATLARKPKTKLAAYRRMAAACIDAADLVVVPSHAMRNMVAPHVRDLDHVKVIPHGFDATEAIAGATGDVLATAAAWLRHEVRLVHISNPAPHKNLMALARMLAEMRRRGHDAGLAVSFEATYPDPSVPSFLREVERLRLGDAVHLLGTVPQRAVFPLYRAANVFLYPSITESFGFPLLEALAVGAQIVASDIPSNRETAGSHARFHDPFDVSGAADCIEAALREPLDADAGLVHAEAFNWVRYARQVADLVEQLAG